MFQYGILGADAIADLTLLAGMVDIAARTEGDTTDAEVYSNKEDAIRHEYSNVLAKCVVYAKFLKVVALEQPAVLEDILARLNALEQLNNQQKQDWQSMLEAHGDFKSLLVKAADSILKLEEDAGPIKADSKLKTASVRRDFSTSCGIYIGIAVTASVFSSGLLAAGALVAATSACA